MLRCLNFSPPLRSLRQTPIFLGISLLLSLAVASACSDNKGGGDAESDLAGFGQVCETDTSDPDGDGWGWEYNSSCRVVPICGTTAINPDGDSWGWENGRTCRIAPGCGNQAQDPDGDGWGWENNRSCRMGARPQVNPGQQSFPNCSARAQDPDGDGWGWENNRSCRMGARSPIQQNPPPSGPAQGGGGGSGLVEFATTYYPYHGEEHTYTRTTCGDARAHNEMYFAVTERSAVWAGQCNNDNWVECTNWDCLSKWDQMPDEAKRYDGGRKMVRTPACNVPCGKRFKIYSADRSISTTAVIYDACPSKHWNNLYKERVEGKNPCAAGSRHVDLRKPLYLHLNRGQENGNIKVLIDLKPLN